MALYKSYHSKLIYEYRAPITIARGCIRCRCFSGRPLFFCRNWTTFTANESRFGLSNTSKMHLLQLSPRSTFSWWEAGSLGRYKLFCPSVTLGQKAYSDLANPPLTVS